MSDSPDTIDRNPIVIERWEKRMRLAIRPLLSKQVIAEHQRNPRGRHSDELKRVLNYFRRSSTLKPYVVVCTQPFREWRVAKLSGVRGQGPELLDPNFSSENEAVHAIFLRRVAEVMND